MSTQRRTDKHDTQNIHKHITHEVSMYWWAWPELWLEELIRVLYPDQLELEVDASEASEGKRFMMRNCSRVLVTQEATMSSELLSW